MAKGVFKFEGGKARPIDYDAFLIASKYAGKDVFVTVTRPRNILHHRKFFALLNLLWETTPCGEIYPSRDGLRKAMTMAAGYVETIPTKKGPREIPKSLAFEKMDQDEFNDLYAACIRLVLTEILPHLTKTDLEAELLEFAA